MRRFWLKKGNVVWDLTAKTFAQNANFMGNPQGLGVKVKIDSFEVERVSFIESVKLESSEIGGKIYFKDYEQFNAFAEFIGYMETTEPLRLYYSTAEQQPDYESIDEWYKLVLIKKLSKEEIDVKTGTVKIEAETDTPLFRIIQDGKILEQAKYNVYVRNQSYLIINSDPAKQEASLYTGANREDVYYLGEKDYAYSNFITIPSGESMFLFTAKNSQFGRVTLSYSLQRELI